MASVLNADVPRYDKDAPFSDPVVRCDSCSKLILLERLKKLGMCECGNRKVRNVQTFTVEELRQMERWGVDMEFIAQFEAVKND